MRRWVRENQEKQGPAPSASTKIMVQFGAFGKESAENLIGSDQEGPHHEPQLPGLCL